MAAIDIEEDFWDDVMPIISAVGDRDKVIGNIVWFWKIARAAYKKGRVVTEHEWRSHGFIKELIPTFVEKVEGGYMAVGAEKHFGWIRNKVEAGSKGGIASAKKRAAQREGTSNDSNELGRKHSQATASTRNPLSLSLSLSLENNSGDMPIANATGTPHWMVELWNLHCGSLPKIKGLGPAHRRKGKTRHQFLNDQLKAYGEDRAYWTKIIQRIASSKFCTGQNDRGWVATFDWLLQADVPLKIDEGKYDMVAKTKQIPQNKTDYLVLANQVLTLIRKGASYEDKKRTLGEQGLALVKEAGGWADFGMMPFNDFTVSKIAGALKAAAANLNNQPSQGVSNESC